MRGLQLVLYFMSFKSGQVNFSMMYLSEKDFMNFIIGILAEKGYGRIFLSKNSDGSFKAKCTVEDITRKRR